jgi:hypothetical protein
VKNILKSNNNNKKAKKNISTWNDKKNKQCSIGWRFTYELKHTNSHSIVLSFE